MHHYIQRAVVSIEATTASLTVDSLNERPPGKWSVAEILEHLTLAFTRNAAGFAKAVETGQPRASRPGFKHLVGRTLVVDLGYFPRARAPETSVPSGSIPAGRVREAAIAALAALDLAAAQAEARFGDRTALLNHPYFSGMNVSQWRKFHWRHTVHHMKQASLIVAGRSPHYRPRESSSSHRA
jgi:Protein of unknown function (DUF1569)